MTMNKGTRLSHYETLAPLGAGGMDHSMGHRGRCIELFLLTTPLRPMQLAQG